MSTIDRINHPSQTQSTDASRSVAGATQAKAKGLVAKDKLDLGAHKAEDAQKQVESEFAARKAAILRQEAAGGYDPDKAIDYVAKRLASGRVEHR
ncbi:MAG: hypothetical protein QF749_10930 [Verrucomicrobiota bacterium]|jgi:hypothetical protein|nr:hypothetical protein [Verrucomicrobiota bacterium]MDP7178796.1 hypothetical protein [Verrucomicrobiota bacterium]MDP7442118.1 hypothetical protein [Verrucomicrobiota bacterium]HJN82472.1 hypothetical protein [Verrucomicrobiota bacterium]